MTWFASKTLASFSCLVWKFAYMLVVTSVVFNCWNAMDGSPPGPSIHKILQARVLEWVAISFSRGSSWPRDRTYVSCVSCIGRPVLYHCTPWEAWLNLRQMRVSQCRTSFVFPTFAAKESVKHSFQFTYTGRTKRVEWRLRKQNHGAHRTLSTCKTSLLSYSSASSSPALRLWFTVGFLSYWSWISYKFTLAERMFFFSEGVTWSLMHEQKI